SPAATSDPAAAVPGRRAEPFRPPRGGGPATRQPPPPTRPPPPHPWPRRPFFAPRDRRSGFVGNKSRIAPRLQPGGVSYAVPGCESVSPTGSGRLRTALPGPVTAP